MMLTTSSPSICSLEVKSSRTPPALATEAALAESTLPSGRPVTLVQPLDLLCDEDCDDEHGGEGEGDEGDDAVIAGDDGDANVDDELFFCPDDVLLRLPLKGHRVILLLKLLVAVPLLSLEFRLISCTFCCT